MIITLRHSGGFAGIEQELGSADTGTLAEGPRREVAKALKVLEEARPSVGADRVQFEVEIREPGSSPRRLIIPDEGSPQSLAMQALGDLAAALGISVT